MCGYPKPRCIARADEMLARGVNVSIGHDSVMDPWYSLGKACLLQQAFLMLHAGHMNGAEQIQQVFDMITTNSAKTLHLDNYGIAEGNQADLIIFDAATEDDILRLQSECTYVIRKGKVICQTTPAKRKLTYDAEPSYVDFKL